MRQTSAAFRISQPVINSTKTQRIKETARSLGEDMVDERPMRGGILEKLKLFAFSRHLEDSPNLGIWFEYSTKRNIGRATRQTTFASGSGWRLDLRGVSLVSVEALLGLAQHQAHSKPLITIRLIRPFRVLDQSQAWNSYSHFQLVCKLVKRFRMY